LIGLKATVHLSQMPDTGTGKMDFQNFSQPADNNQAPIREQLDRLFSAPAAILEIGSGSGQHAVYMASHLPHLRWQPTDQGDYFAALLENIQQLAPANVLPPVYLDIAAATPWPKADNIYMANVVHIMPAALLQPLFQQAARTLPADGKLCVYGPFKYAGEFTTASNADFDLWLKSRNPLSGIRDIETLQTLAQEYGFTQHEDLPMPANNQLLVFVKTAAPQVDIP
jgi:SAM-dependent methyltransferase